MYKQQFEQPKTESTNQNTTNSNKEKETPKQPPPKNREYQRKKKTEPKVNYSFWLVVVLLVLLYLYNANKTTTTGNTKADSKLIGSVYSIYNNTGRVVLTGKLNSQSTTIELSNLSGGIYISSVGENMKQTFKIIKAE